MGEYDHKEEQPFYKALLSNVLDLTIIKPLIESCCGYDLITGEDLTEMERNMKVIGALVDLVTLATGIYGFTTAAKNMGWKKAASYFSQLALVELASDVSATTVATIGDYCDWPMGVTMLLSLGTGLTVGQVGNHLIYESVAIYEDGNKLMLMKLEQSPNGAYLFPKSQDSIEVEMDVPDKGLGIKVMEMFRLPEQAPKATLSEFETTNGSTVKYRMDIDGFIDAGDGHTDAYQVFWHENDENTFLAFMIDSGYKDINEDAIKSCWEKRYGNIAEYEFQRIHSGHIEIMASAKTKNAYIRSYFYRDAEDWLELSVYISEDSKLLKDDIFERKISTLAETVEVSLSK